VRYFFDTEFEVANNGRPTALISIGVVSEEGKAYYAENENWDSRGANDFVKEHVVPNLWGGTALKPLSRIRHDLMMFTQNDDEAQFWGYYAAYDWVFMCMLFGGFFELPSNWRKVVYELDQWMAMWGIPRDRWPEQQGTEHHALNDAAWNQEVFLWSKQTWVRQQYRVRPELSSAPAAPMPNS
jgi:hypothetical protein